MLLERDLVPPKQFNIALWLRDAKAIRRKLSDCIETAAFRGQDIEEQKRLLHMVSIGHYFYLFCV